MEPTEAVAVQKEKEYFFRPYTQDDLPFVHHSWGSSYYKGASYHQYFSPAQFHHYHRPIRDHILQKPTLAILVAASREFPELITAYLIAEKPNRNSAIVIHYIYVKEAFKGQKIASSLLKIITDEYPAILFSHLTERANRIMSKAAYKYDRFFFAPHIL